MSAKINVIIPKQNFEEIQDQIAVILGTELDNQQSLDPTFTSPKKIWQSRTVMLDKSEFPALNLLLYKGDYVDKTNKTVRGIYTYFIDVYTNSKGTADDFGDTLADQMMRRIIGKIRAILHNPDYRTLGFVPGNIAQRQVGIEGTEITGFRVADKGEIEDALHGIVGRIVFEVRVPESADLTGAPLISELTVTAQLAETDNGFFYDFVYNS